ncbi:hypothetical protein S83_051647 [Arachis hypogaea]
MGRNNNVPYALLVILMIGVIICSTVADFSDAIRQRPRAKQPQPWLPTYHDVSDMNPCKRNSVILTQSLFLLGFFTKILKAPVIVVAEPIDIAAYPFTAHVVIAAYPVTVAIEPVATFSPTESLFSR